MRRVLLIAAFFAGSATLSGAALAQVVDEVRVQGNQRSEADAVLQVVGQRPGQPLDRGQIRRDIGRIFRLGFYTDVKVDLATLDGKQVLTYVVAEKPSVRLVRYSGNDELDQDELGEVVDIRSFSILDLAKVARNAEKIRDLYIEKGFFLAEVDWDVVELRDNQVDVVFRIVEKEEVTVARIVIVGNDALSDDFIKERIETREGGALSFMTGAGAFQNEAFERDQLRIAQFYYDQGYIKARVGQPRVELSPDRARLFITIPVEEGERYRTGDVDVVGDFLPQHPKEEVMKLVALEKGEWFSSTQLRATIDAVGELYKDDGYAYVNVAPDTRVDEESRTVSLAISVQKGEKVRIGRITMVGNSRTRDKVIRREMRLYEGEYYSSSGLKRSERLINRLGFFETVTIRTMRGAAEDLMDIVVEVKEKPTGTFQIGAGFSSIESFVAQAQISQNNLFGRGQTLSLQAQLSSLRSIANVQFADDYFLDSRVRFATNLYRYETSYEDFTRQSLGGDITFGYPLGDDWSVAATYTLEEVSVAEGGFSGSTSGVTVDNLYGRGITSSLKGSLFYDTRNNRLFPSAGIYAAGSVEHADEIFLSENEFTRYTLIGRYYYDVGLGIVAKVNGKWGLITSPDPRGVPLFERFFVGGPLSVRGFRRLTLGPDIEVPGSAEPDAPNRTLNIGGTEQFILNLELEFPIFERVGIRGVGFVDGGNAFDRSEAYADKLSGLRYAWGFGIRWFSPIGPLRFEWGFPFAPVGDEEESVFEFSIGNFF